MKRLIAVLLITIILLGCTACKDINEEKKFIKIDEYTSHLGYVIWVVVDPETQVEYFMRGDMMCPRYDENGNISFYEGE